MAKDLSGPSALKDAANHEGVDSKETQETKRVNFHIPVEEHRKLKTYAAREGKTITEIFAEYISGLEERRMPWEGLEGNVRMNLLVTRELHAKLKWVGERVPATSHRFAIQAIERAVDREIDEVLAKSSS